MNYATISVINGNFKVEAEHGDNLNGALVFFAQKWATLLNAQDVERAVLKVVNENFIEVKSETVEHPVIEPVE